ncbi:MAG TPA: two-component regulator propeller domain-containing protein [Bacteroidales bacterium]|nr:two-component regulator propeller domain-containing protein [Bacteroidales bacterium]
MKITLFSRLMISVLPGFLLLSADISLQAQLPHLSFKHIGVQDGLSTDDIRRIFQDKDGFMWFGGEAGTDRYDGKDFYNYFRFIKDTTMRYLQSTTGITEDVAGNMWFLNDSSGVVVVNKITELTVRFKNKPGNPGSLSSNRVRFIYRDSHGNIWITTSNAGLNLYNPKDSTFIHFQHIKGDSSSPGSNNLACIAEDPSGKLWISSPHGLLIKFDPLTGKSENIQIIPDLGFTYEPVVYPVLHIDRQKRIWYSHLQSLYLYDPLTSKVKEIPVLTAKKEFYRFDCITSILDLSENALLITTLNDGFYLLDTNSGRTIHYNYNPGNPFGICSNHLLGSFRSADSVIWIPSSDNGVSIYSKAALRFSRILNIVSDEYLVEASYPVYSIFKMHDGKILAGTENNGLYLFNPITRSMERFLPEIGNTTVFDLFEHEGKIWIATWLNGLYVYDIRSGKVERLKSLPGLSGSDSYPDAVRTFVDSRNRFWFGSMSRGLVMYNSKNKISRRFAFDASKHDGLWSNLVFKIIEDKQGIIWIATASGLNRYNEKTETLDRIGFTTDPLQSSMAVYDIYDDSNGNLWLGTEKALFKYNRETNKSIQFYSEVNGNLRTILQITPDKNNVFWLGTNAGILSFDLKSEKFRDYSVSDDIRYIACNPNSGAVTDDQIIYIGSSKGLIRFEPENISDDTLSPKVVITGITVNSIPLRNSEFFSSNKPVIKLSYKQNNIGFAFAALHYVNSEGNQFKYMLKGYDKDWIKSGNVNKANYQNLPPGNYTFRVIASNSHGYWNLIGREIQVQIKTPLWHSWLFRVLFAMILLAAALIIYYGRVRNLKKNQLFLEKTVKERTKELFDANTMLKDQHNKLIQQHEEIAAQNEQLSQMSAEILKQNKELEDHRQNLENLIAQRTGELEVAFRKAEESDRLKSAFLANMSHEIRTPMNAIVGFANLLKEKNLNEDEKTEFIDIINSNSETLLVLIDDILDLSLIEANQLVIRKEDFNLNEVLDHLYSSFSLMNRNRDVNIRLNNELHELNILLFSDRVRITQILTNLLSNACKFTSKGFVELGAVRKDEQLMIYVQDSGIGIKQGEQHLVFERFRKSMEQSDTLYRGTGLGLAICKAMSGLLGATISMESELNVGSTFFLMIPWEKVSFASIPKKSLQPTKHKAKKGEKEILIVEDEKANYLYAKKMLNRMNVNVHWAENGLDAVKLAASGIKYDIILMDIKMPVLDGYEATKKVKAANPRQTVIAITAYARPEDRLHFMNAGFDDYISKPIKPNDFMAVISRYL